MASSMSLALVLSAVDKMGPILKNAEDKLKSIKRTTEGMKKMEVTINIKEVRETVQKLKNDAVKKSESLQRSGAKDIAEGTALGLPVFGALKEFGELEKQLNNYTIATYDSSKSAEEMAANVRKAEEEAMKLGDATKYNTAEAIRTFEVLAKGGIDESVITGGLGKGAIYLAQLEELNPEAVAGSLSTVSNAFDKGGAEMYKYADHISRASDATKSSVASLSSAFTYSAGTAATLKQTPEEATTAIAILQTGGLPDTVAGTSYNNFLSRMIPKSKQQIAAMEELDLLDAQGRSIFMDAQGKIKPMEDVIGILRKTFDGMRPDDILRYSQKIWGEEGARAVPILKGKGENSWESVNQRMGRSMSLDDKVGLQNTGMIAKAENVGGSFSNLLATAGKTMGNDVKGPLDQIQEVLNGLRQWIEANPQVARGLLQLLTFLAMFKIGAGIFKLGASLVLGFGANILTVVGWVLKFAGGLSNLRLAFAIARGSGFGFFRAIWEGVKLAWPWIGKLSAFLWRFVGQWLIMAARIAFGWLMAMGPVGVVIAVVGVIIAAAIWAWNNNFMGFRDKCKAVWESVGKAVQWFKEIFSSVYNSVAGWINGLVEKFGPLIQAAKDFLGLSDKVSKTPPPPLPGGGGGGGGRFNQTNNVNVNSPEEAADYVGRTVPGKYEDSRDTDH